ncbi:MAG: ABC transporter permease [Nocardioidaceae bacterium]|nr:ABC transporter permease [Nocardioidaceae bacterium]
MTFGQVWDFFADAANWQGPQGISTYLAQQLLLSVTSIAVASLVGLPIALWLGHLGKGGFLAINVSNVGRAVPTYAVLALLALRPGGGELGPYGREGLATLIALTLFALPPIITNAYVGMREVDREMVDAAQGMGMRGGEVFGRVELPLARPLVLTGLRLATVQVWATATIAALVAGPGLGNIITQGFATNDTTQVVAGALLVAVIAVVLEGSFALAERALDPLRASRRAGQVTVAQRPASGVAGAAGK